MNLLWLNWKDKKHPLSGGAEMVNEELAKRLAADGHQVIFLVSGFENGLPEEVVDGYKIVRLGNRWTVYWRAYKYYKKYLSGWADLIIDEINTVPFFAKFYASKGVIPVQAGIQKGTEGVIPAQAGIQKGANVVLFIHQLCRQIWFYQMFFPVNLLGYILEPLYLRLLRDRKVITVSQSTKNDLIKYGFKEENIKIISEGIEMEPIKDLSLRHSREDGDPVVLSLGAIRSMKRTHHIIRAFELAKEKLPNLRLRVAGSAEGKYGKRVLKMVGESRYNESIEYLGKISKEKKIEIMQRADLLAVTSVKEGWGLVVTEANSQGTPAVVYDVDGLRDAVKNGETGIVCQTNTPENLAENIVELLQNKDKYERLRLSAWQWSKEINFEKSYEEFVKVIKLWTP